MIFEPSINVITNDSCNIYIEDTSNYFDEAKGKHQFKYSDTMSIYALRHNKIQENVFTQIIFSKHDNNDFVQMPINLDGWFSVIAFVLPTKEWFNANRNSTIIGVYDFVYFTDGVSIYKYCPKTKEDPIVVPLDELIELNLLTGGYTVYSTEKDYVSICFLRKCYINLCNQIFNNRGFSSCWNKSNVDSELVYKRDLVWMAINVITYLTETHSECKPTLSEVERLIEIIQGCNGLCLSSDNLKKSNGCGCSK